MKILCMFNNVLTNISYRFWAIIYLKSTCIFFFSGNKHQNYKAHDWIWQLDNDPINLKYISGYTFCPYENIYCLLWKTSWLRLLSLLTHIQSNIPRVIWKCIGRVAVYTKGVNAVETRVSPYTACKVNDTLCNETTAAHLPKGT